MPYIQEKDKTELDHSIDQIINKLNDENLDGKLNYIITRIISGAYNIQEPKYSKINDIVGVLECAKLEFYRRIAIPYEDQKIKLNGDVKEYKSVILG